MPNNKYIYNAYYRSNIGFTTHMPTMKYRSTFLLYSLFAFLSTAYAVTVELPSSDTCAIQAWVRAPDLDPGEIIPGQVRIQTKGPCSPISEYSLILRFIERTRVKILKPGVEKPQPLRAVMFSLAGQTPKWSIYSVLEKRSESAWVRKDPLSEAYAQRQEDPALWDVAEQERIAFETRYKLFEGPIPQSEIQSIHDFALLVPTTNYPPSGVDTTSFDPFFNNPGAERGNEHVYLYTVEVKFVDGTTMEIPAGRSSFNTVGPNSQGDNTSEIVSFVADFKEISRTGLVHPWTPLNISFNVDVTFPYGRHLEQGSTLNLTFAINGEPQANPSIILSPPSIDLLPASRYRRMEALFPGMDVPDEILPFQLSRLQLSPTSNGSECPEPMHRTLPVTVKQPYWNKIISVSHEIPKLAFPSFDMYYQSIEAKIKITLTLQYVQTPDPLLANNDYAWIPTLPDVTRLENSRFLGHFRTSIPVTIYPRARKPDYQVTHYLSPDARQPVFVDPREASKVSKLSVTERDFLAPRSEPVINEGVNSDAKGVRIRYSPHGLLYYVGDTWQRKVLDSGLN